MITRTPTLKPCPWRGKRPVIAGFAGECFCPGHTATMTFKQWNTRSTRPKRRRRER